jgi:hypothetical protein
VSRASPAVRRRPAAKALSRRERRPPSASCGAACGARSGRHNAGSARGDGQTGRKGCPSRGSLRAPQPHRTLLAQSAAPIPPRAPPRTRPDHPYLKHLLPPRQQRIPGARSRLRLRLLPVPADPVSSRAHCSLYCRAILYHQPLRPHPRQRQPRREPADPAAGENHSPLAPQHSPPAIGPSSGRCGWTARGAAAWQHAVRPPASLVPVDAHWHTRHPMERFARSSARDIGSEPENHWYSGAGG